MVLSISEMDAWNAMRRRTVENATMLCALTETPEDPKENCIATQKEEWALPLSRERQLAEDFVFISSYRDSPDEVMAVCIEEGADGRSMHVRVASNTGGLVHVVNHLERIADIMMKATTRGDILMQSFGSELR